MSLWTQHLTEVLSLRGELGEVTAGLTIRSYSGPENERDALNAAVGVVDRSYRGLLEITGGDRAAWLHNLTTNQVKTLSAGDGHYAFVLNLQGRILFDVNVLVDAESIWLDLDRQWLDRARSHFDKYTITEDVTVTDRSEESVRFGIAGPRVADLLAQFDAPHAPNWPSLGLKQFAWSGETIRAFRHDFCGAFAVECVVPAALAVAFWEPHRSRHSLARQGDHRRVPSCGNGAVGAGGQLPQGMLPRAGSGRAHAFEECRRAAARGLAVSRCRYAKRTGRSVRCGWCHRR